jgi:uncharacterized protein (DUF2342 family)
MTRDAGDGDDDTSRPDPFSMLPMFGDLAKALAGQGPLNWEAARQFAALSSTGGSSEVNVDPQVRMAFDRLASIAEMHVRDVTGIDAPGATLELTTPGVWAQRTLDAYRPLFTELAVSLGRPAAQPGDEPEVAGDPMMAMMASLSQMMAPSMMGMAIGSMVGRLATRAFGLYDLPIPRGDTTTLLVVPRSVDAFAESWSLAPDEMRLWVLAQELIGHAVFSHAPVREAITSMVRGHVGAFRPDPGSVAEKLSSLEVDDDPMQAVQRACRTPRCCSARPLAGADRDGAGARRRDGRGRRLRRLHGRRGRGAADRRRRAAHRRGRAAPAGGGQRRGRVHRATAGPPPHPGAGPAREVLRRRRRRPGREGVLPTMFTAEAGLPTPSELDAPGLWLARTEL